MKPFVKREPDTEANSQISLNESALVISSSITTKDTPSQVTQLLNGNNNQQNPELKKRNSALILEKNNLNQLKSFLISTDPVQIPLKPGINTPEKITTTFVKKEPENELEKHIKSNNINSKINERAVHSSSRIEKLDNSLTNSSSSSSSKKHKREKERSQHKKFKQYSIQNSDNITTATSFENKRAERIPKNPLVLQKLKCLLFDINKSDNENQLCKSSDLLKEVFEGLEDQLDLSFCKDQVNKSLNDWITYGEELNQKHLDLTKKLIQLRIELSYKFKIIIEIINSNSDYLLETEKNLDNKLIKIKDIGNDILNLL